MTNLEIGLSALSTVAVVGTLIFRYKWLAEKRGRDADKARHELQTKGFKPHDATIPEVHDETGGAK